MESLTQKRLGLVGLCFSSNSSFDIAIIECLINRTDSYNYFTFWARLFYFMYVCINFTWNRSWFPSVLVGNSCYRFTSRSDISQLILRLLWKALVVKLSVKFWFTLLIISLWWWYFFFFYFTRALEDLPKFQSLPKYYFLLLNSSIKFTHHLVSYPL